MNQIASTTTRPNVDFKHPEYQKYAPEWTLITACIRGERAIQQLGTAVLPHPATDPTTDVGSKRYKDYQTRAAFLNATSRTLQALLGLAFYKPIQVELSGRLAELEDDADGRGLPMTQFVRQVMSENTSKGRGGIMPIVDSQIEFDDNGNPVQPTAEQVASNRGRLKFFREREIINWKEVGGKTTLVVCKYDEEVDDGESFEHYKVTVWHELRLINGRAYARKWYSNQNTPTVSASIGIPEGDSQTELTPIYSNGVHMDELPWAWVGSERNDSRVDVPPLEAIARLNCKHYIAEADIAEHAHIVGGATLWVKGMVNNREGKQLSEKGVTLGSTTAINLGPNTNGNADIGLLQAEERTASTNLAERREKQLAMLGAALIERGTAPKTATEAEFDARTDNSVLSNIAGNTEAAINRALSILGGLLGGSTGHITMNKKYSDVVIDAQGMTAMMAGVQTGSIRLIDFVRWMMAGGLAGVDGETPEEIEDQLRNAEPVAIVVPTPVSNSNPTNDNTNDNQGE